VTVIVTGLNQKLGENRMADDATDQTGNADQVATDAATGNADAVTDEQPTPVALESKTAEPAATAPHLHLPDDHPLVTALAAVKAENQLLRSKSAKAEDTAVAAALKDHMVALHQIEADDADLFLTAVEPSLLLKQVARLLDRSTARKKNTVSREGDNPQAAPSGDMREFARDLFARRD
jgi:hypothetical protein